MKDEVVTFISEFSELSIILHKAAFDIFAIFQQTIIKFNHVQIFVAQRSTNQSIVSDLTPQSDHASRRHGAKTMMN